jgi:hypothetical protein
MMDNKPDNANAVPEWQVMGDWIDVCSCNIPCPCSFAQAPTGNVCDVIFGYKIKNGHFGETDLAGLKVVIVGGLKGNLWASGDFDIGMFIDAAADQHQREALEMIFTGKAGGWMEQVIPLIREFKGIEVADIVMEVDEALQNWRVEIPNVIRGQGEALTGPTADPHKRVQTINLPGSEVGPSGKIATWGKSIEGYWRAFGFSQDIPKGQSSKHIAFEWNGPHAS